MEDRLFQRAYRRTGRCNVALSSPRWMRRPRRAVRFPNRFTRRCSRACSGAHRAAANRVARRVRAGAGGRRNRGAVRAALTDGTDLKTYRRGHPKMPMPTRFGHEFCGDVAAVGDGVTAFVTGDAVMCAHTAPCGRCFWCRNDQQELCEELMPAMLLGAYADLIAVPRPNCRIETASANRAASVMPKACFSNRSHASCTRWQLARRRARPLRFSVTAALECFTRCCSSARGVEALLFGRRPQRLELRAFARAAAISTTRTARRRSDSRAHRRSRSRRRHRMHGNHGNVGKRAAFVRRGGRVSFFAGLPAEARVSFLAGRLHYDEVQLVAPFHFTPANVREAYELIASRVAAFAPHLTRLPSTILRRHSRTRCRRRAEGPDRTVIARTMRAAVLYDVKTCASSSARFRSSATAKSSCARWRAASAAATSWHGISGEKRRSCSDTSPPASSPKPAAILPFRSVIASSCTITRRAFRAGLPARRVRAVCDVAATKIDPGGIAEYFRVPRPKSSRYVCVAVGCSTSPTRR